jgi:hypothetical protein
MIKFTAMSCFRPLVTRQAGIFTGILLLAGLLLLAGNLPLFAAAEKIELSAREGGIQIKSDDWSATRLFLRVSELDVTEIKTAHGTFTELSFPKAFPVGEPGSPKLPAFKEMIEVPMGAEVRLEVSSFTVREYSLSDLGFPRPIYPVQPSRAKTEEPGEIPFFFQREAYEKAGWILPELAEIEVLGTMRGIRLARLTVAPVAYDPGSQTIRVYNDIEITLHYDQSDKSLSDYMRASTYSPFFEPVYQQVVNPRGHEYALKSFPDLLKLPVKMLIVSHPDFRETLHPFIEWQTQKGFQVKVAYTDEIGGTASAIRQYTRSQYLSASPGNPAPTFLVLVGDTEKLPPSAIGSATGKVTDLYYASIDGDYFPEMYYGRLSARTPKELQNQVNKILAYQQYAFDDPSFLGNATLIAGHDFTWNQPILQPTVKYAQRNYFHAGNGFKKVNAVLSNYDNVYNAEKVSAGVVTFTGHCTPTSWASPTLSAAGVHALGNTGKFPLVIGNCCQSALFSHTESIAEAWVRAENRGAVAYVGSAPDTHWFEDFYWSVGAFPMQGNNEGYVPLPAESSTGAMDALFSKDYFPVGALKIFGNLAVTQAHIFNYQTQANILWYWQGYHTFGDPSTLIYLSEGKSNNVWHMPFVPVGHDRFVVEALPGSYVAVSSVGQLHGAGFVDATGKLALPIKPFTITGQARVVVTRPQSITYIKDIPVSALEGPYVQLENLLFYDELGNLRQRAIYGEKIIVDLYLKNIGTDSSGPLTASLTSADSFISLAYEPQETRFEGFSHEPPNNTFRVANAFTLLAGQDLPNLHQTRFFMDISDGDATWESSFLITGSAPVLEIDPDFFLSDLPGQKSLTQIDPDGSALIGFRINNTGNARARNPKATLNIDSPYLTIVNPVISMNPMEPQSKSQAVFQVSAHPSTPPGKAIPMRISVEDGRINYLDTSIFIGQAPDAIIGNDDFHSIQYPFYNLYRANRTQLLYFADEIGEKGKTINTIGLHILQATASQNIFPNFRIRMRHTNLKELPASFVSMEDAPEVFYADAYQMPTSIGWHFWNIADFPFDGKSNVLVEISWGMLDDWTSPYYRVACTPSNKKLVSFGFSDLVSYPLFNGNAKARPNLFLGFSLPVSPPPQPVTFVVDDWQNPELESLTIRVGSTSLVPENGTKTISLVPGQYYFSVVSNGGELLRESSFLLENEPKTVEIYITGMYDVLFHVLDNQGEVLPDAFLTIEAISYEPGMYLIQDLVPGDYRYTVSHPGFFDYHGEFEIMNANREVVVEMVPDATGIPVSEDYGQLEVFPNPASEWLTVRLNIFSPQASLVLLNSKGVAVIRRTVETDPGGTQVRLRIGGLPAGIYYLRAETGDQVITRSVMIY